LLIWSYRAPNEDENLLKGMFGLEVFVNFQKPTSSQSVAVNF